MKMGNITFGQLLHATGMFVTVMAISAGITMGVTNTLLLGDVFVASIVFAPMLLCASILHRYVDDPKIDRLNVTIDDWVLLGAGSILILAAFFFEHVGGQFVIVGILGLTVWIIGFYSIEIIRKPSLSGATKVRPVTSFG